MPKQIVRKDDKTAHGGTVMQGCMSVFANGKPIARILDFHECKVQNPVPHIGGPIAGPGCPTVLVGGQPVAVVGDTATCNGPPDVIISGSTSVFVQSGN